LLIAIFIIFALQLFGEALQQFFELAIPGPVIGLILLLASLILTKSNFNPRFVTLRKSLVSTSEHLLGYLSLLFVPIGVGVVMHLQLLETQALRILLVILLGTIGTMIFTSWFFSRLHKKENHE